MGCSCRRNKRVKWKYQIYRLIFFGQGLPNFSTRDLATLNNTLSISHNPRPLAVGPIRNT